MDYQPQSPHTDLTAFNRVVKTVYFTLFASVGLYWIALELVTSGAESRELGVMKPAFWLNAGGLAALTLYFRFSRVGPLLADTTRDLSERLPRLRADYIICFGLSEAVALLGFVLRFLGGSRDDAASFFLASVVLFLLCYPRVPQTLTGPRI